VIEYLKIDFSKKVPHVNFDLQIFANKNVLKESLVIGKKNKYGFIFLIRIIRVNILLFEKHIIFPTNFGNIICKKFASRLDLTIT
jgi:hypothetical protein